MTYAILLAAAAEGFLSLMDALIKSLTVRIGVVEIAFLRFAAGVGWASLLVAVTRPGWPSREAIAANGLRSILSVFAATLFFFGLSRLPLADAIALSFLSPSFMALLGALLLGERIERRTYLALALGFVGMIIIVGGHIGRADYAADAGIGALAVMGAAFAYALVIVLLRSRATRDAVPIMVLIQNIGPAVLLAIPAWLSWSGSALNDLPLFVLIGFLGVTGHYCLTKAFARATTSRLAPIHYTSLVWGVVFGWVMFGDVPGIATLIGAAVIIVSSLPRWR